MNLDCIYTLSFSFESGLLGIAIYNCLDLFDMKFQILLKIY